VSDDEYKFLSLHRLKGRLLAEEVAFLLNCSPDDVQALTRAGLLKPLGNPPVNGKKFFATKKVLESIDDPNWLARVTNTIYRRWQEKNASRRTPKNLNSNSHARF
jgi:hypothetical protein